MRLSTAFLLQRRRGNKNKSPKLLHYTRKRHLFPPCGVWSWRVVVEVHWSKFLVDGRSLEVKQMLKKSTSGKWQGRVVVGLAFAHRSLQLFVCGLSCHLASSTSSSCFASSAMSQGSICHYEQGRPSHLSSAAITFLGRTLRLMDPTLTWCKLETDLFWAFTGSHEYLRRDLSRVRIKA